MRVMRSSIYIDMEHPPLTTVVRDCDVVDTLEGVRESTRQHGALCLYDIFDVEDNASIGRSTLVAMRRWEPHKLAEFNMAVSYHWNAAQLLRVNDYGTLGNDKPAPLDADECRVILSQLAEHENYQHQTIMVVTKDHQIVALENGELKELTS